VTRLGDFALFHGLDSGRLADVEAACAHRSFGKSSLIVEDQAVNRDVYFLLNGHARVVIFAGSGKEISFRDLGQGQFFGEFAALDHGPRSACVIATTAVELIQMPEQVFRDLVFQEPAVLEPLMVHLIGLLRHYTDRVMEFSVLPVSGRVHAELLRLAQRSPAGRGDGAHKIRPFPTHQELAARLGTHREAVTRELNRLAAQQIVATRRGEATILDMDALSQLVLENEG